jgi:hypothetical protein
MSFRRVPASAALAVLTLLLAGCGGHPSDRLAADGSSAADSTTGSASSSTTAEPLTTSNVYHRVQQEASDYTGLRGTMTLLETTTGPAFQVGGSFATNLQDYGEHTSDLQLRNAATPPKPVAIRAIDSSIYFRLGSAPWQNVSLVDPTSETEQAAALRDLAAQLLAGLDPQEYTNLLSYAHGLKEVPAGTGADRQAFAGTIELDNSYSVALRYFPGMYAGYEQDGVTTETFTVTFDGHARPTALHEHLASAKLTIDYQLTITGYNAAKVSAPI